VRTECTIRFALWNNEETGHTGSRAYVEQCAARQGKGSELQGLTASRISSLVQHQGYRGPAVAHHRCAKSLHWRFAVET
jgi:hypothetical protein